MKTKVQIHVENDCDAALKRENAELKMRLSEAIRYKDEYKSLEKKYNKLFADYQSLLKASAKRDEELLKAKNMLRGCRKLVSNVSEKQKGAKDTSALHGLGQSCSAQKHKVTSATPKERGNNGAKRKIHEGLEVIERHIYPSDPKFDKARAKEWETASGEAIRYVYHPGKVIKYVYHLHAYKQDDMIFHSHAPSAPLLNSNFDASIIVYALELHYMHGMSVAQVAKHLSNHGFDINRSTLNGLLQKIAIVLDGLYKALSLAVLKDSYVGVDETFIKVKIAKPVEVGGKQIKKGYMWVIIARNLGLVYYYYSNGSWPDKVAYDKLKDYKGTIQSDGKHCYRKMGSDPTYGILRLPCLQHIKRKFLDIENDPDALLLYDKLNEFYMREHEHTIGINGWTEDMHLEWRKEYSASIIDRIDEALNKLKKSPSLQPRTQLHDAVTYLENELPFIPNIFTNPHYSLDNNLVETYNRGVSQMRKNSLFFGSHNGAEHGALFLSLASSCKMLGIDFYKYMTDVLNRSSSIAPNAPYETFRKLIPDEWIKTHESCRSVAC